MLPESTTIDTHKEPEIAVKQGSRNIAPHVANLVITNLREVSEDWWAEIKQMLSSRNVLDRKFAITEINKVQLKAMPTQLNADEGISINVNIVQYGSDNPTQLQTKTVSGTIIEGDGLRDKKGGKHLAQAGGKG